MLWKFKSPWTPNLCLLFTNNDILKWKSVPLVDPPKSACLVWQQSLSLFYYRSAVDVKHGASSISPQQRSFMVTEFARTNNITQVLVEFRRRYPNVRCPSKQTVYHNGKKYQITGTSHNLKTGRSGRPRSGRNAQNINTVRQALEQGQNNNQRISSRRNGLQLSQSTFNRITRLDLQYHPYQMIKRHEFVGRDQERRMAFSNWLLARPPWFLENLLIGDEACFCLNSSLNTHNIRQYDATRLLIWEERFSAKCNCLDWPSREWEWVTHWSVLLWLVDS